MQGDGRAKPNTATKWSVKFAGLAKALTFRKHKNAEESFRNENDSVSLLVTECVGQGAGKSSSEENHIVLEVLTAVLVFIGIAAIAQRVISLLTDALVVLIDAAGDSISEIREAYQRARTKIRNSKKTSEPTDK